VVTLRAYRHLGLTQPNRPADAPTLFDTGTDD
jgi:hypothetical protein